MTAPRHRRQRGAPSQRDLWRVAVTALPLTLSQYKTAIALSEFMDYDTLADARPGVPLLVERTQLAERTVKAALKFLRDIRIIKRTYIGGWTHGEFTPTTYVGLMPPPCDHKRTAAELREQAATRKAEYAANQYPVYGSLEERRAWRAAHPLDDDEPEA